MVEERVGSLAWLRKQVEVADKDLLREIVRRGRRLSEGGLSAVCGIRSGEAYGIRRSIRPRRPRRAVLKARLGSAAFGIFISCIHHGSARRDQPAPAGCPGPRLA